MQVAERIVPLLFQIPGVSPEWVMKYLIRVLDDRIDYEDALDMSALSIVAMNGQAQAMANGGGAQPGQGGAANAPQPNMPLAAGPNSAALPVT
ncbi:hypothetical protein P7F88_25560 [Vibrio hannami]|uniref:hypothetical protein n=1 Tax=Vibrio hannami TaxID=2717094 RepID=UPI002410410C|nr:hypothetical protein [Vibrio hannami]MDG3089234.1 hypothetical protein [Vibrio hannami]